MKKEYHFIKEIKEQPQAVRNSLQQADDPLRQIAQQHAPVVKRVLLTGCGDPYMLAIAAAYAFENWSGLPCEAIEAAELSLYRHNLLTPDTLLILITSSGKTVKVIDAARLAKERSAPTFALTNLVPSPITEETETVIQTQAGWSDSFPTKQTTTALADLYGFALHMAEARQTLPAARLADLRTELYEGVPAAMQTALQLEGEAEELASEMANAPIFPFIGSGPNLATALLSAAKMKETSQSRSEAFNLEEYAHLHSLSLKENDPVFLITSPGQIGERNRLVCQHILEQGGRVVVVGPTGEREHWANLKVRFLEVPDHTEMFGPLVSWLPYQMFAYYVALQKQRNPDRPPERGPMDYLQKIIYTSMLEGWENR